MKNIFYLSLFAVLLFTLSSFAIPDAHATSTTISNGPSCNAIGGTWSGTSTCTVSSLTINSGDNVIINSGIVFVNSGILTIHSGGTLTIYSYSLFANSGTLDNFGNITTFPCTINNTGIINNNSGGTIFSGGGTINNNSGGTINNNSGGYLNSHGILNNNSGGTINNNSGGTIQNWGQSTTASIISNHGTLNNSGIIIDGSHGTINNFSIIIDSGTITIVPDSSYGLVNVLNNFNTGTITNNSGGTITSHATLNNGGTIINNSGGTLDNSGGKLINTGTITNNSGGMIKNSGTLTNSGTIAISSGGTLINTGTINNNSSGIINNHGTVTNNNGGTLNNSGTLTNTSILNNNSGSMLTNTGTLNNNSGGTINNHGTTNNSQTGTITNDSDATIYNYNTLANTGIITNNSGGMLTNFGTITNNSSGTINNHGTVNNSKTGIINNNSGSKLNNYGTIINSNVINNQCGAAYSGNSPSGNPVNNILCNTNTQTARTRSSMLTTTTNFSSSSHIPSWIKNNAKWWSEGTIDDATFKTGIQYLIQQNIIKIPATQPTSSSSSHIPSWIKNNAKWWSEGSIGDGDFLKGIEYLVQQNIIALSSTTPSNPSSTPTTTITSVSSSTNPSVYGQSVTFTATISWGDGTSTPTGTVVFADDGKTLGASTLSNSSAIFVITTLSAGTHTITATYSGDTNYSSSTSSYITQIMNEATTTPSASSPTSPSTSICQDGYYYDSISNTCLPNPSSTPITTTTSVSSSTNPSVYGQSVTFTATVSASSGSDTPTGTVQFIIDKVAQSPTVISEGHAVLSLLALSVGSHTITATYSGDTNYSSSMSSPLTQIMNEVATATIPSVSSNSSSSTSQCDTGYSYDASKRICVQNKSSAG